MSGERATGRAAIGAASRRAPAGPGVYAFLGRDGDLLYVGKAADVRRRLAQHARSGPASSWLHRRYDLVAEVRWEPAADEEAAAWREADLLFALAPPFNAESASATGDGVGGAWRATFVRVTASAGRWRFELVTEPGPAGAGVRRHGCFPHLGKGRATRPGTACSDGYAALLRLVWAASGEGTHVPAALARTAPPDADLAVEATLAGPLDAFLRGTSRAAAGLLLEVSARRPAHLQPALRRDAHAALAFQRAGPAQLRARRLRHGLAPGPVPVEQWRRLVAHELAESIGPFTVPVGGVGRRRPAAPSTP